MTAIRKPNRRHVAALERHASGQWCMQSGKVCFRDQRSAALALAVVARRDPEAQQLQVYRCNDCRDWHFGHDRRVEL